MSELTHQDPFGPQDGHPGKKAAYLSFDNAVYSRGVVPCQWLVVSYYISGLEYCVSGDNGIMWSISKKQIKHLMSRGKYVWVKSRDLVPVPGKLLPFLEIGAANNRTDYRPVGQRLLTLKPDLDWLGPFASMASIKGRARAYYFDGRVGASFNIANAADSEDREAYKIKKSAEAIERSAEVWAQAHERARGY